MITMESAPGMTVENENELLRFRLAERKAEIRRLLAIMQMPCDPADMACGEDEHCCLSRMMDMGYAKKGYRVVWCNAKR